MKLSEILFSKAQKLWDIAAEKEFLIAMAKGTLEKERYRNYMLQDYYYLLDYKDILEKLLKLTGTDSELQDFIEKAIEEIVSETENVHIPAMKMLGISDADMCNSKRNNVITDYIKYYKEQIAENGLMAGMVALLQCSWNYAYLGKMMYERYRADIEKSCYKFWFDAYTSEGYLSTNEKWINLVDRKAAEPETEKKEIFCKIFKTCAEFENKFWDSL